MFEFEVKMARDTETRREQLKTALIDAAERSVIRDGVSGIRARDLAKEAKCAVGAIYNVVPDLDALIYDVNARTFRLFETYLAKAKVANAGNSDANSAVARLVHLATIYLDFAVAHHARWRALFEHRVSAPREQAPDWYIGEQARMFTLVEQPLAKLRPDLQGESLQLAARTIFSAVHGVVSLGLDAKLMALPHRVLRDQVASLVEAIAAGQGAARGGGRSRSAISPASRKQSRPTARKR